MFQTSTVSQFVAFKKFLFFSAM